MKEIRRKLFMIIFEHWLITLVICALLSVLLSRVFPNMSFWLLFAGNIVGATSIAAYYYITRYIKIKRLINSVNDIFDKIKSEISDETENKETKI